MIKKLIKNIVSACGYELLNKDSFGYNLLKDLEIHFKNQKEITIFDIGANLGQTSVELQEHFPQSFIHAFEPDVDTFEKLKQSTKHLDKIAYYNLGFGNSSHKTQLNINKNSGGNSILPLSDNIGRYAIGEWTEKIGLKEIEITTLDEFCEKHNIKTIDVLKIDTQGYELRILEGGANMVVPSRTKVVYIEVLFVELYKNQAYFNDVYEVLVKKGYRLTSFYNKFYKTKPPHYLLWCDAIFICDDLAKN